ncbi:helix-turn-helix domain-containing protein [Leptospira santarosai]|uniref:helix-turn-helix domain-containing protein n=1 Tax=Leptospira santarosai TaxID=28183 RepID=UPI0024AFD21A|nr:helix-turn-helix transcriptional regulator [Leptospira santarosai]MDI7165925.1 helix-turn-helix transcriptional regulator [Leptospira santarosai]
MKNVRDVIATRKNCLRSEAEDREFLIEHIRKFVDAKRGNQKLLAEASGVRQSTISNLIRNAGPSPGMEVIVTLAEAIQKI